MEFVLVLNHALKVINKNKISLLQNLWLPVILIFLTSILDARLHSELFSYVVLFFEILVYTIFAVTIHRIIIIGPGAVEGNGLLSWSKRESTFALHLLFLYLMIYIVSILNAIPFFGGFFVLFGLILMLIRFSLVFPGIAVDKGLSFGWSWELTAEFKLIMFFTVILLPALLSLITNIVLYLPLPEFFLIFYTIFAIVFQVAALSSVYQLIMGEKYTHIK